MTSKKKPIQTQLSLEISKGPKPPDFDKLLSNPLVKSDLPSDFQKKRKFSI
jgi:hypothetical protein